jgi:hypothetical protein
MTHLEGQTRVLIAPCGCIAGADVSDEVPGFCRSVEEAREDIRDGFTEGRMTVEEFRATNGCTHIPEWGVSR